MKLRIGGLLATAFLVLGLAASAQAKCGKVTISEMNWDSAAVAAHVEGMILSKGYGCQVELVPGDTVPTVTSMTEKGEPDIAPEIWINSVKEVVAKAEKEGRLKKAGEILSDGGEEAWWVPDYVVKANPELTTLQAVMKRPDLFEDKEEPGKGRFYGCPSGWACQIINTNLFKAYGLDKAGFTLFDPGSGPGSGRGHRQGVRAETADLHLLLGAHLGARKVPDGQARRHEARPRDLRVHHQQGLRRPETEHVPEIRRADLCRRQVRGAGARGVRVRVESFVAQLAGEQAAGVEGRPEGGRQGDRGALPEEQRGRVVEVGIGGRGGESQGGHVTPR